MLAEVVACIGALLADALAAAHAAGIIHRDIKPANVLIAPGGRLLLADFGVARLETEDSLVTKTGALLGTPAYMSPEQASGDTATAQSDLYSLGATLYQLATGALPYARLAGEGDGADRERRAGRRRCAGAPAVGPDLSRVIERLMATDPSARPGERDGGRRRAARDRGGRWARRRRPRSSRAYFADPEAFVAATTPRVVTALVAAAQAGDRRGEAAARDGARRSRERAGARRSGGERAGRRP